MIRLHTLVSALKQNGRRKNLLIALFVTAFIVSLIARFTARHIESMDYIIFLKPWTEHLATSGLSGLADNFSNYNAPYLVLLWLASLLPFSDLTSIKLISVVFDIVLAVVVTLIVRHYRPKSYILPGLSFLVIMFAPTVLQNSAVWGQCDSIYTSFLALAYYMHCKNRPVWIWLFWGVALAFKFQAIFFLPFLGYLMIKTKITIKPPLVAFAAFIVLSFLPIIYGRSIYDTFGIYLTQASPNMADPRLALNAATAYQWIADTFYISMRHIGTLVGLGVALFIASIGLLRMVPKNADIIVATLCLLAIPFFLPVMHERYMYPAEVFLIIASFVYVRILPLAIIMQVISTITYLGYFDGGKQDKIPYMLLSAIVLYVIYKLSVHIYRHSKPLPL